MAKRTLAAATNAQPNRSAVDLAEEITSTPAGPTPTAVVRSKDRASEARFTDRMSISLLKDERNTLEDRARDLQRAGRRDLKPSRLARIAFKLLMNTPDEEVLHLADEVPNLEQLRVK
jgi:hypothetical protein